MVHSNSSEGKGKGKAKGNGEKLYVTVEDIKSSAIGKSEQIGSSITKGKEGSTECGKKETAAQKRSASSSIISNAEKKIKTGPNKSAVSSSSTTTSPAVPQVPTPIAVGKLGSQKERKPLLMQKSQVSPFSRYCCCRCWCPFSLPSSSSSSSSSSFKLSVVSN